jgi:tRNA threonylcarbamoyladenosine biosynthesis protein TsaB
VVTDARRREVYWAAYADRRTRVGAASVARPADVALLLAGGPVIGPGTALHDFAGGQLATLSAGALADAAVHRLTTGGELLPAYPLYLRRPDATPPSGRKRVLA